MSNQNIGSDPERQKGLQETKYHRVAEFCGSFELLCMDPYSEYRMYLDPDLGLNCLLLLKKRTFLRKHPHPYFFDFSQ